MSVLDTFYILFKTNKDEVKKGFDEASAAGDKFEEHLSAADRHVAVVGEKIKETFKDIGLAIAGAFAAEKLFEFGRETIETNARLAETQERIGGTVEDLGALQAAVTRFGGSADGVTASIDFLNKGIAGLTVAGGTSRLKPFFDALGISAIGDAGKVKSYLQIYREIAGALAGKTTEERAGIGERFGLDPGLLLVLSKGRQSFDELIAREKELGVTSQEDAEHASEFMHAMADLRQIFFHVATAVTSSLLPALQAIVDGFIWFTRFIREHQQAVQAFFVIVAGALTTVYLPAVIRATIATLAFLAPFILIPALIGAVIAAFALLYDDIQNFLAGNKSVIGELAKKWPEVGQAVRTVAADVSEAFRIIKSATGEAARGIGQAFENVKAIVVPVFEVLKAIGGAFVESFRENAIELIEQIALVAKQFGFLEKPAVAVAHAIGDAFDWLGKEIAKIADMIAGFVNDFLKNLPSFLTGGADAINTAVAASRARFDAKHAQTQIDIASSTPIAAQTSTSIATSNIRTTGPSVALHVDKIEVNAPQATDGPGVAAGIGDGLKPHIKAAISQFDDGVAR